MSRSKDSFGLNILDPANIWTTNPGGGRDAWKSWLQRGRKVPSEAYLMYNSFSGIDCRAAIWIPPNKFHPQGTYKVWAELQTVTISSERPAGPVRCLGIAGVRDHVRGVRTIAGSLIFTVLDVDIFLDILHPDGREAPAEYPIFVDMIPPFHIILNARNEMGSAAGLSIIDCTLTNLGQTFSVDDLLLEATYTYVAKYVTPFMNKSGWQAGLAQAISNIDSGVEKTSNAHPRRRNQTLEFEETQPPDMAYYVK
jgi:hypothetical protein